jgi:hypothetical protein
MTKTTTFIASLAVVLAASTARAQTPSPEGTYFVKIGLGAQPMSHDFDSSDTFTSFGETGSVTSNQSVGGGFLFDITGGYQLTPHLGFGVGVWSAHAKGGAASVALMPDPLFVGRYTTVNISQDDLKQTLVGVNFQVIWRQPIGERIEVNLSGGPTILHVSQEVGTINVAPNTSSATAGIDKQSKTTGKAGNVGVDVIYHLMDHVGLGLFVGYAGGTVDLPSVDGLSVGGAQVGGVLKYGF